MPLAAISAVSAGALAYELLLMRLYAVSQWHHVAFMIISVALLGYGASGTFLSFTGPWLRARFRLTWSANAVLFGVTAVFAFGLAQRIPFNPLEVLWAPSEFLWLGAIYLVLMTPFFFAANCIGLAFTHLSSRIGHIYGYDLVGAGVGAAGGIVVLFTFRPEQAILAVLGLGLTAAAITNFADGRRAGLRGLGLIAVIGVMLAVAGPERCSTPKISEYKPLSAALRLPAAAIVAERSGPLGLVTVVQSLKIPFRHAPGLSLNAPHGLPEQRAMFVDGAGMSTIARWRGDDPDALTYLDFMPEAAPYHLLHRPRVLVLGLSGGEEVLRAHYHNAHTIEAVEADENILRILRGSLTDFTGGRFAADKLRVHIAGGRSFLAGTDARYDLIQLPPTGVSPSGAGGFAENYLYTVEAFERYLGRLAPGGLIAVTLPLKLPPRYSLKLFAAAVRALEGFGGADPSKHLAMVRSWQTITLLVATQPLTVAHIAALKDFARARSFDLAYYPGMPRAEANRYNRLEEPHFYDGAVALLGPDRQRFMTRYKFDLHPANDNRPYPFDVFRWRSFHEKLALRAQGGMGLIDLGYPFLVATLIQAATLSSLLILAPLIVLRGRGAVAQGRFRWRVGGYFLAIGLGFLLIEITFIQRLTLFLGHPLYAVSVVLATFLVFAGLGAAVASNLIARAPDSRTAERQAVLAVAVLALVGLGFWPPLQDALMASPAAIKVPVALAFIAPLAFVMGMPFPLGLAVVAARAPALIPWAWGINGCASVIGAVLAVLLAMELGFTAVVAIAAVLYLLAAWSFGHD